MEKVGKILGQLRHRKSVGGHTAGSITSNRSHDRDISWYERSKREGGSGVHSSLAVADAPFEDGVKGLEGQAATVRNSRDQASSKQEYFPRRRRAAVATDLTKVKLILSKVLSHRGLDKKVERYEFILHWHKIVGERLAEVSKPECIVNQRLMVNVLHPAWAQELTMIKPVLLESLTQFLRPGDVVRDMVFRVKSFAP